MYKFNILNNVKPDSLFNGAMSDDPLPPTPTLTLPYPYPYP